MQETLATLLRPPKRHAESAPAEPSLRLQPREIPWLPALSRAQLATVMVLAAVFLVTSFARLNHTDLWGHLNFGRWIAEHHRLPDADPFRDRGFSESFVNAPWLSQLLGYRWFTLAGLDGLTLANALLATTIAAALLLALRARGLSLGGAALGAGVAYILTLPIVSTLRPQLCGELCFALTLLGASQLFTRQAPLFWLPAVFIAWANLHGSAPLGIAVLLACLVGCGYEQWGRGGTLKTLLADEAIFRFGIATGLALLAMTVNPAGWRGVFDSLAFAHNPILSGITEWQPLTVSSLSGVLFFMTLLLTGALLRYSPRPFRAWEVILLVGFGLAALSALRMLAWWSMVWPWIALPHLAAICERRSGRAWLESVARPTTLRTLIATAVVFATLVWSPATHGLITGNPRPEALAIDSQTPLLIGDALAQKGITGRVFAPLDWADYFVWKTHAAVQPLIYSHVHLADQGTWNDYQKLTAGVAEWLEIADYEGLQYLVIRRESQRGLDAAASRSPRCHILYRDQIATLVEIMPIEKAVAPRSTARPSEASTIRAAGCAIVPLR
ncbi:MAG TPA: hypothetical protein VFE24_00045 [Pirellulales bacterium]|jgi:hypothetical protein|nr:hypothetical protein [Pirellulales bacterium]